MHVKGICNKIYIDMKRAFKALLVVCILATFLGCSSSTSLFAKVGYDNVETPNRIQYKKGTANKFISSKSDIRSILDTLENISVEGEIEDYGDGEVESITLILSKGGSETISFLNGKLLIDDVCYELRGYEQFNSTINDIIGN